MVWVGKRQEIKGFIVFYVVTYTAEDDRYDRFLGKIEKMIKSFQIVSTDERG
jgi:hypothetical protein